MVGAEAGVVGDDHPRSTEMLRLTHLRKQRESVREHLTLYILIDLDP